MRNLKSLARLLKWKKIFSFTPLMNPNRFSGLRETILPELNCLTAEQTAQIYCLPKEFLPKWIITGLSFLSAWPVQRTFSMMLPPQRFNPQISQISTDYSCLPAILTNQPFIPSPINHVTSEILIATRVTKKSQHLHGAFSAIDPLPGQAALSDIPLPGRPFEQHQSTH